MKSVIEIYVTIWEYYNFIHWFNDAGIINTCYQETKYNLGTFILNVENNNQMTEGKFLMACFPNKLFDWILKHCELEFIQVYK